MLKNNNSIDGSVRDCADWGGLTVVMRLFLSVRSVYLSSHDSGHCKMQLFCSIRFVLCHR